MAKDVQFVTTCDPCDRDGYPGVTAVASHVVAIDGGPEREVDVCARDEIAFQHFLRVYKEHGREVSRKAPEPVRATRKPKAVKASRAPKELERTPSEPKQVPPADDPGKQKQDEPELYLICPLGHASQKGAPKRVAYKNRSSHTEQCHPGIRFWDVEWEDPDGILTVPCISHVECMKTGLAFTSEVGRRTHVYSSQLQRIDTQDT